MRRHVPDFLLDTSAGLVVVDVKPAEMLADAEVAEALDWRRPLCAGKGWGYEVWSGADWPTEPNPPPAELRDDLDDVFARYYANTGSGRSGRGRPRDGLREESWPRRSPRASRPRWVERPAPAPADPLDS